LNNNVTSVGIGSKINTNLRFATQSYTVMNTHYVTCDKGNTGSRLITFTL